MKLLIVLAVYAVGITVGYLLGFLKSIYTYERGATEQRKMDIDKAVAWVDHNVGPLSAMALRKAMEK